MRLFGARHGRRLRGASKPCAGETQLHSAIVDNSRLVFHEPLNWGRVVADVQELYAFTVVFDSRAEALRVAGCVFRFDDWRVGGHSRQSMSAASASGCSGKVTARLGNPTGWVTSCPQPP